MPDNSKDGISIFDRVSALEDEVTQLRRALAAVSATYAAIKAIERDAQPLGKIIAEVAASHRVPVREVIGESRKRPVAMARHHAMAAALDAGFTSTAVARAMHRDHSTVLHGAARHRARLANG